MKWIELLKPVDNHPAGKFLEVEDNIARAYIEAGFAKDGGDGPDVVILQRSLDTFRNELKGFVDKTANAISEATAGLAKRPVVRADGLEFEGSVTPGESEADKSKGIGDFVRCAVNALSCAVSGDIDGARVNHERLTKVYKVERTGTLERASMTESTGSSLGYTTPVIYESQILKEAAEEQVFLNRARRVPLGARQVEWPALDQFRAPAAGQPSMFGGVTVSRKGETAQRSQSSANVKKVALIAQDLTCFFALSRDLLQDSTAALDAMVPALGGEAIGWRTDWECWNGTGVGQMLGVTNSPALINVARGTAGRISYGDVFSMYTRLLPRAKAGACWHTHPFAMSDIMQLKDVSGRNVYLPVIPGTDRGPIGQKVTGWLLGLPIVETEKVSPLGTPGDLSLCAMDRYLYGERSGLEVGISEHFYFDTDQVAIRLKLRNDGKPQLRAPIYLSDGSGTNQVSAFVSLQ